MVNPTGSPARVLGKLVLVCLLLSMALVVKAGDINVRDNCSLSNAIKSANQNKAIGGCEAGTALSDNLILTKNLSARNPLPTITSGIYIVGNGRSVTFGDHPAFTVDGGSLTLKAINVRFSTPRHDKVMLINDGELTLIHSIIHDCTGGISADESTIELIGTNHICDHGLDVILAWFGIVPPEPQSCEALSGSTVTATLGLASGVQCRQIDAGGIGIQSVIDAGFIDAVDVWGYVEQGVDICFPQLGSITFLDAATSPRAVSTISSYRNGNSTCTHLTRPGTVLLVPGAPTVEVAPVATQPTTPATTETALTGCTITATGHLKFLDRASSEAEIIGYVTRGTTVSVVSRVPGWYQVSHQSRTGWVGGRYTARSASCD